MQEPTQAPRVSPPPLRPRTPSPSRNQGLRPRPPAGPAPPRGPPPPGLRPSPRGFHQASPRPPPLPPVFHTPPSPSLSSRPHIQSSLPPPLPPPAPFRPPLPPGPPPPLVMPTPLPPQEDLRFPDPREAHSIWDPIVDAPPQGLGQVRTTLPPPSQVPEEVRATGPGRKKFAKYLSKERRPPSSPRKKPTPIPPATTEEPPRPAPQPDPHAHLPPEARPLPVKPPTVERA